MWKEKSTLKIAIQNLSEFRALLDQAEKEAQQLNKTLNKLSCFTIDVEIATEGSMPEELSPLPRL